MTAKDYVSRVFVPRHLPLDMSTRSFLSMACDLLNKEELKKKIAEKLLGEVNIVPRMDYHFFHISLYVAHARDATH